MQEIDRLDTELRRTEKCEKKSTSLSKTPIFHILGQFLQDKSGILKLGSVTRPSKVSLQLNKTLLFGVPSF